MTTPITAPPLDLDLASVDTSMPLLKDNEFYQFSIDKIEIKPTSSNVPMIAIDAKTTMPAMSIKGEQLGAGIHVFGNIMLQPSGKSTWDMVGRNLAEFVQSIEGGVPGAKIGNAAQWVPTLAGRTFKAKIGYAPEGVIQKGPKAGQRSKARNEFTLFVKSS